MKWLAQLVAPASLLTWWPDDHLHRHKVRAIYLGAAPAAVKAESSSQDEAMRALSLVIVGYAHDEVMR